VWGKVNDLKLLHLYNVVLKTHIMADETHSVELTPPTVTSNTDAILHEIFRELVVIRQHLQRASGVVAPRRTRPALVPVAGAATGPGAPWTDAEMDGLLIELKQKLSWADIAKAHGRSENGVKMRLGQFFGWRNRQGDSWEALAEGIDRSVGEIQEWAAKASERRARSTRGTA